LLFLGNSDDLNPEVPEDGRAPQICARLLASLTGHPWEVEARAIWPSPELPNLIDRWLDRFQPDLVLFKVNWYWYGYESVPVRVERLFGKVGKPVASLGLKAAGSRRIGHTRSFKLGRRLAHRMIGGDSPFTPELVIDMVELCLRRIVTREGLVVLAKGTATYDLDGEVMIRDYKSRFAGRRDHVEGTLQDFCRRLSIGWADNRETLGAEHEGLDDGDGLHKAAAVQDVFGRRHARDLVAAMRAAGWDFSKVQESANR
jgi:hypothetical protein